MRREPQTPRIRHHAREDERERDGGEREVAEHQRRGFVFAYPSARVKDAKTRRASVRTHRAVGSEELGESPRERAVRRLLRVAAVVGGGVPRERKRKLEPGEARQRAAAAAEPVRAKPAGGVQTAVTATRGGVRSIRRIRVRVHARRVPLVEEPPGFVSHAEDVSRQRARRDEREEIHQRHIGERGRRRGVFRESGGHGHRLVAREPESFQRRANRGGGELRSGRLRRRRRQIPEPFTDARFEAHEADGVGAAHVGTRRRVVHDAGLGGNPTRARLRVRRERFGGHVEATKVFVALHGEDGGFDATNGVQALGGEDVTPGGMGLVHDGEPVAGVALQALDGGRGRGAVRGRGGRGGTHAKPRVAARPPDRREHGVVVDGVRLVPGAEGEDAGVERDVVLELRGFGGEGGTRGGQTSRGR